MFAFKFPKMAKTSDAAIQSFVIKFAERG